MNGVKIAILSTTPPQFIVNWEFADYVSKSICLLTNHDTLTLVSLMEFLTVKRIDSVLIGRILTTGLQITAKMRTAAIPIRLKLVKFTLFDSSCRRKK